MVTDAVAQMQPLIQRGYSMCLRDGETFASNLRDVAGSQLDPSDPAFTWLLQKDEQYKNNRSQAWVTLGRERPEPCKAEIISTVEYSGTNVTPDLLWIDFKVRQTLRVFKEDEEDYTQILEPFMLEVRTYYLNDRWMMYSLMSDSDPFLV